MFRERQAIIKCIALYKGVLHFYVSRMAFPSDRLFTRQQLGVLTGIADDVLAFWLKEGLLIAQAGGGGRGKHRLFDYPQVHIAAVLNEMRGFGTNIGGLRSLAELLQQAVATCKRLGLKQEYSDSYNEPLLDAGHFDEMRSHMANGHRVKKYGPNYSDGGDFETFEEWLAHEGTRPHRQDGFEKALIWFEKLKPGDGHLIDIGTDLICSLHMPTGRGVPAQTKWSVARRSEDQWLIFGGDHGDASILPDPLKGIVSFVSIRLSDLIRSIWTQNDEG